MGDLAQYLQSPAAAHARPTEKTYGPFGEEYTVEYVPPPDLAALLGMRFGFRGLPQAAIPKGPWTPPEPRPQAPARELRQAGDDSVGQHIYEGLLGRTRDPGDAVAQQGTSPLIQWLIAGLGAYGGYKGWSHLTGIDLNPADLWRDWQHMSKTGILPGADPNHPKFDPKVRDRFLGDHARFDANKEERKLADSLGIQMGFFDRTRSPAAGVPASVAEELDRRRLPGGVGREPY